MEARVDKGEKKALLFFDLKDEDDRNIFVSYLKQIQPRHVADQLQIDKTIIAAGGTPEHSFNGVNYENMQQ